jgi:predicted glycosyltransferase
VPFVTEPDRFLRYADRIITMGGYNSTCEALRTGNPTLIVPRTKPRREQAIRAERLRDMGLVDLLYPDELTPGALTKWIAHDAQTSRASASRLDWSGLARMPELLDEVYLKRSEPCHRHHREKLNHVRI